MRPSPRRFGAAFAVVLMLVPFSLAAHAQTGCAGVIRVGEWTTIAGPSFDDALGPLEDGQTADVQSMTDFAIVPAAPEIMYATNGRSLQKTRDGGCHWQKVFAIDALPSLDVPLAGAIATIRRIEVPDPAAAAGRVYLAVEEKVGPVSRVHIVQSGNGGADWEVTDEGLPPVSGAPLTLRSAPSDPKVLYLSIVDNPGENAEALYASTDGGRTWDRRSPTNDGVFVIDLAVNPQDAADIWQWGGGGLFHSVDGGRTRAHIQSVAPSIGFGDVSNPPGGPYRVMVYEPETTSFSVSQNGGATWYRIGGAPGFGLAIAHTARDTLESVHGGVFRFKPPSYWLDVRMASADFDPEAGEDMPDLVDLVGDQTPAGSFFGRTPHTIMKYTPASVVAAPFDVSTTNIALAQSTIQPKVSKVKVPAGEVKELDYKLNIPAVPTPLDVFFLMDTTASMQPSIAGLRDGIHRIVEELAASKIDVRFGLGEIKDYPIPGYGDAQAGDFPYRLDRAIGPADQALSEALATMEATGGGRDFPESQLTGLYQAATGSGEPGCAADSPDPPPDYPPDAPPPPSPCVPPGEGAGFRDDALKVIVNITDAEFHDEAAHPSPPSDAVATALRNNNILQVGLAVFGPTGADEPRRDLSAMAKATGTRAPSGGIDCDGDGKPDVSEGEAVVCEVADEESDGVVNLAPAIISTLKALTENAPVELVPATGKTLVDTVLPGEYPTVDIKEPNHLGFSVDYACPHSLFGSSRTVRLVAKVSGAGVATAKTKVICGPADKRPVIPPAAAIPALIGLTPVPAPQAVVAVAPAPPPPAYQTTTSPQNVWQMQAAMMPEEQEQAQVAIATAHNRNQEVVREEDYSFSSMRHKEPSPVPLYLGAAAITMMAGTALALRRRFEQAVARTRR